MPICSYLVIPRDGEAHRLRRRLARIPACEVVAAKNRDLLLLVTDTSGLEEEAALRSEIESVDGIEALLFTFGEIDPDADYADPVSLMDDRSSPADGSSVADGSSKAHRPSPTEGSSMAEGPSKAYRPSPTEGSSMAEGPSKAHRSSPTSS